MSVMTTCSTTSDEQQVTNQYDPFTCYCPNDELYATDDALRDLILKKRVEQFQNYGIYRMPGIFLNDNNFPMILLSILIICSSNFNMHKQTKLMCLNSSGQKGRCS